MELYTEICEESIQSQVTQATLALTPKDIMVTGQERCQESIGASQQLYVS